MKKKKKKKKKKNANKMYMCLSEVFPCRSFSFPGKSKGTLKTTFGSHLMRLLSLFSVN